MAVYPANDSTLVNQIGEILGADLDVVMSLNNLDGESCNQSLTRPEGCASALACGPGAKAPCFKTMHGGLALYPCYSYRGRTPEAKSQAAREATQPYILLDQGC